MSVDRAPPLLPLVLWRTSPALAEALTQEGVPHVELEHGPAALTRAGRFVLYDSRRESRSRLSEILASDQDALDVDALRRAAPIDPFAALLDTRSLRMHWEVGGYRLTERVNRHDRTSIRRRMVASIRDWVIARGGVWASLAPYPHPYRSAFNFRVDLDEPCEADYWRFATARRPIDHCTTHFVSTAAYGGLPRVLADLRGLDVQSHGHFHVVYRDPASNRRNLERADAVLRSAGFAPHGFAAPEGRWNTGLDDAIESLGYRYSSEFQVGYDDLPFNAWRGDRPSRVLQIPVHPICEGLFLDAGATDGRAAAEHLAATIRARIAAGRPAFVYGHPEKRLGRFPEVLETIARTALESSGVWRVTLGEFAQWWRWRGARRWSLAREGDALRLTFDDPGDEYTAAIRVDRGGPTAWIPVRGAVTRFRLVDLAYEPVPPRLDPAHPMPAPISVRPRWLLRDCLGRLIDWETVTPLEELPSSTPAQRWKKRLRAGRDRLTTAREKRG
jgi:hypothetical protein